MTRGTAVDYAKKLLVAAGFSTALFWAMSLGTISHSGLAAWDSSISRFFVDHQSEFVVSVAQWITSLGVVGVLLPTAFIAGAGIFLTTRSVALAIVPLVSVQVTAVMVSALKQHYGTVRPSTPDQIVQVLSPAFPSGHAANTVALVTSVALVVGVVLEKSRGGRRLVFFASAICGAVMGATRIVLNVHWLSDVVGGICLGFTVAAVCVAGGLFVATGHRQ